MRTKIILRLILALIFGTLAVIYSQLIPPIPGTNPLLVRFLVTLVSALVGFLVFPDIAKNITLTTMSLFNFVVHRLSSEVLNQMVRISRGARLPNLSQIPPQPGAISYTRPLILDTSSIIDGRILDICKTGFINGLIYIPKYVLLELQQVADSSDGLKRARGRRGFEVVEELKKITGLKVEIWDKEQTGKSVDDKLLNLAKNLHGRIVTTDFNLNKLASISNLGVLNVNDLANAVKTVSLPGEELKVKIAHIGKGLDQGVGYLTDGTMIVVSAGAERIGQTLKVEVTKSIQIPAGRMIFAKEV